MRHLPRLPVVLRVEVDGGDRLVAVTPHGPLSLYRYAPLQAALRSGLSVPFAAGWPEHLKLFVYAYAPLPALDPQGTPPGLSGFGARARDAGGLRPWTQATYRGWPLYLWALDRPGAPPGGRVVHLFESMTTQQAALPPPGSGGQGP